MKAQFGARRQGLRRLPRRLPREALGAPSHGRASVHALMRAWYAFLLAALLAGRDRRRAQGDAKRGAYLAKAAGCVGCHTEEKDRRGPLRRRARAEDAVRHVLRAEHHAAPEAGIGRWSEADFLRALRLGVRPDGAHYFPGVSLSLVHAHHGCATCATCGPSSARCRRMRAASRRTTCAFPFGWRFLVAAWKWLFFSPGPFVADPARTPVAQSRRLPRRGPRPLRRMPHAAQFPGRPEARPAARGRRQGARRASAVPNLTPTKLKKWSDEDLKGFPADRDYAGRRRGRGNHGRGRPQHDQPAHAGRPGGADRLPARAAAAARRARLSGRRPRPLRICRYDGIARAR